MSARRVPRRNKDIKTGFWMAAASKIYSLLATITFDLVGFLDIDREPR
jgi:hypothetical protein